MVPTVAILNQTSSLTDDQVQAVIPDVQTQVTRDFAAAWAQDALIVFVPAGEQPAPDAWQLILLDDSDQAGALGYHLLGDNGLPLGKVFVNTTAQAGELWTVVLTHELLEMLADPSIDSVIYIDDRSGTAGWMIPVEACDAVEGGDFAYTVGSTVVSDFVWPSWWQRGSAGPWDQEHVLSQSLYIAPGGYIGVAAVQLPSGWQQVTGDILASTPGGSATPTRSSKAS